MYQDQIIEKLNDIISYKQTVGESTEEGYFNKVTAPLVALGDYLREQMQAETSEKISKIINNLKSDEEITEADLMLIRLWIVGDAASYVQMENDYQKWLEELNRLFGVIEELKGQDLSLENMYKLQGTARDAIRVIGDIVFFKQQQERIDKFENASKNLNSGNKLVLAKILKQKLESEEM
jgi:Asp-tRNA(Asn)/Glu-tRNA(Gln) amidotransferase C subunit